MKRFFTVILFSLLTAFIINAQCSIDYTYYPVGVNYGLHPDTLPNGVVGQSYLQDLTFYLPLDTIMGGLFVEFEDFHITSISLPLGLTWECNNSSNACHYDPTVSQYGCVNVSGIPLVAGIYDVDVNLVATHSFSSIAGTENISFTLPFTILPDTSTSSNIGFAMTNPSGCAPITVSFDNNNVGMLSYSWDFGNGNNSVSAQPGDQIYSQPGEYIVSYNAVQSNAVYFLESIEITTGNCSDGALTGDPDFFYTVSDPSGIIEEVDINNQITQNFPLMVNSFNPVLLNGQSITVDLYDDDSDWFSTDIEDCGSFSFTPMQQAGVYSANGGGLTINYTVMEIPANTISVTDTINVYGYPDTANIVYDTVNAILYTATNSFAMQWYYYNSPIPNATDTFYEPTTSGLYSLVTVNEFGCATLSENTLVIICDTAYQPILSANGMTVLMEDSALFSDVQWYDDYGLIIGAIDPFFAISTEGSYYISATDSFGCSYFSKPLDVSLDIQVACNEFTWIDGLMYTASNNIATHVLTNTYGYDSVVVLDLTINYSPVVTIAQNGTILGVTPAAASYLWSTGEVTQTIIPVITGWHWCIVTDANGCESEKTFYEVLHLSTLVHEMLAEQVLIYPNPTKDFIIIDTDYQIDKIKIINMQGSVCSVQLKEQTIDVSNISDGIYFIEIHTGKSVLRKKFIKN